MNTITSILRKLPDLKTSTDFGKAITNLETEHAAAVAAVGELEAGRESAIFDGGDLGQLERDIAEAQGRAKTLNIAKSGAERRRTEAVEAEAQAKLVKVADGARKLDKSLRADMIEFALVAETLSALAGKIQRRRADISKANLTVREGGRSDLAVDDPIHSLVELVGRQVTCSIAGLQIPEFFPRRLDGNGPALLRLRK